jgi:hypothetical protein
MVASAAEATVVLVQMKDEGPYKSLQQTLAACWPSCCNGSPTVGAIKRSVRVLVAYDKAPGEKVVAQEVAEII